MCVSTASLRRLSTEGLVKRDLLEKSLDTRFCAKARVKKGRWRTE